MTGQQPDNSSWARRLGYDASWAIRDKRLWLTKLHAWRWINEPVRGLRGLITLGSAPVSPSTTKSGSSELRSSSARDT